MNKFESDWISLSQSQSGVRVCLSESERNNKVSELKMTVSESSMAEFKMAAIINLSQNEWVKFFLCKWWKPILASVSDFERKYYDGQIQDYQNQDGWHHHVKWEWMSLSQIELVWVRVRVEWECFWVNLRDDNRVSESKMAVAESNMAEFKMAAIIKSWVRMNEWSLFLCKMAESKMAEFKMSAIIKLSENESLRQSFCKFAESKMAVFKMAVFNQNEWVMFFLFKMAESKMADFKMVAIIKLIRLN